MGLNEVEAALQTGIRELSAKNMLNQKRIYLFGWNAYTVRINNFLCEEGYRLSGIIDNDKQKQGKRICNILTCTPEEADWERNTVVLIASRHRKVMEEQLQQLSGTVEIYSLFDFSEYEKDKEKRNIFWEEEKYQAELRKLNEGAAIYKKLKEKTPMVVILPGLGDIFVCGLYFHEYKKKVESESVTVVISSQGSYMVAQMFRIKDLRMISEQEMELLVKFLLFNETNYRDIVVCSCISTLDTMARYKKIPFPVFWAKYFFRLDNDYQVYFPSIWDGKLDENEMACMGMIKGKTVILAPYTNTIAELPIQFWEILTEKLIELNYCVFTNVTGMQNPVRGSMAVEIPLHQIGNYLDYAGYFISLRSGLCDVAGHSNCKQIIIFRDSRIDFHNSVIEFFDLHAENISDNVIQYIYDDNDFFENINVVLNYLY